MTMNIRTITEEVVRERWVQRLSDTPNRRGRFGTAGMTAAEMGTAMHTFMQYADFAAAAVDPLRLILNRIFLIVESDLLVLSNGLIDCQHCTHDIRVGGFVSSHQVDLVL